MKMGTWLVGLLALFVSPVLAQEINIEARHERKSATEEEAAFRGRGDYLRDLGGHLESRATAYGKYQDAERQRLENLRRWHQDTAPARHDRAIDMMERQLRRFSARRLNPSKLQTGEIRWPDALLKPEFQQHRQSISELVRRRSNSSANDLSSLNSSLREASGAFDAALRQHIEHIPKKPYLEAARFLRNLAYEATFPDAGSVSLMEGQNDSSHCSPREIGP